ncbi:MAG: 16S rRNA (guanine(966)-N(2))-methyltransferase RsmD [Candidatus Marinimicrobia bacterium]|jgi:16S rRNA (guanine966-N2)-methyltransferase|nr:16S rRNA (guanine(966)-N(2))-methyltransferase RsmD [Candidatus Neomarinimicrobiota bacterium]MBT3675882.1 16S rRNA (guanine(966)-N(2))-methyltransferase RsmD [Candidatus Neomarinimicrobiota bacterium]MBT3763469.1 16S rRNA (guanine(966)-N(2))-methyltransferase RsmD [Candidatus Neomarinimicrobiota bacterium]MBT4068557.1 16S rRNA (guanine(966)-N(2))-methyltransferase RsmD [Candidatus Neomarinimicrobiota bacterium]MBT4271577.1 16S rRNA (guanine(966)-N(2))-methyltransferase RsmD [Candidatus Neom
MQIQAGRYKGRRVKTVANAPYRPTTSIVRKSLFDILGDLSGYHILDLYAGSGILGFEASSRGAESVTFVETSMRVVSLLKMNGSLFKESQFSYIRMDALKYLDKCESFDLIIADPPYQNSETDLVIKKSLTRLKEDKFFILESSPREFSISPSRVKLYGDTQLTFWRNTK